MKRAFRSVGLEIRPAKEGSGFILPVEFSETEAEIYRFVTDNKLTMVTPEGIVATLKACKHAVLAEVPGDFVECGVWRGGNAIAAKMLFEAYGSDKKLWLFDTFTGMSEPTDVDRARFTGEVASETFEEQQRDGYNAWCYASLEDVQRNFQRAGLDLDGVRFVKGDVSETLQDEGNLPEAISVLRLDTDWYESTKSELERLYPRLSHGGSLLIDDFGYWEGARKAVEEYVDALPARERPLLHCADSSGRMGVKP